jgi:hypothetical protein
MHGVVAAEKARDFNVMFGDRGPSARTQAL